MTIHKDEILRKNLESLSIQDDEYWSFKGNSNREYAHGLCQYPAMMVPQLTRVILDKILSVYPDIERIGDPFVGSGTVLTESMMKGLKFYGIDINPLSILLCKVKKGPFQITRLKKNIEILKHNIQIDNRTEIDINFNNVDKWFRKDVQASLCKIRRNIQKESNTWVRNFFWVSFVETVKNVSNSRTSTFKLHIRMKNDIENRQIDPVYFFLRILHRNSALICSQVEYLKGRQYLHNGKYSNDIDINIADVREHTFAKKIDLIITSPPYGDNATTVPYGQYSYLPLQWIDIKDIDEKISYNALENTHSIDSASLGGSLQIAAADNLLISQSSPSFAEYSKSIKDAPRDRIQRVSSFFRDLNNSLPAIISSLSQSGLMVWVLGNRKVGGERVPFDKILTELLEAHGATLICKLTRSIPSKRMAIKNSIANTMSKESIIVIRKN